MAEEHANNGNLTELSELVKNLSVKYTAETPVSHLKKQGQYFTVHPELLKKLLEDYKGDKSNTINILEPACGTGCIIAECLRLGCRVTVTGVEIEKKLAKQTVEAFEEHDNVRIVESDFLVFNNPIQQQYDLIIGNPPYFETKLTAEQKQEYSEIVCGRTNVYSLFIYRSIEMLKEGGELRFIIPRTILSGKYFSKLREFIHKHCDILDIIKFSKTNLFSRALQSVIILKLRKRAREALGSNNCVLRMGESTIYFVKNKQAITAHNNDQTATIQSLGCRVKTGGIVWNQHKTELESERKPETVPLVMANNLKTKTLVFEQTATQQAKTRLSEKKQYMRITDQNKKYLESGPCVLVNRIVGMDPPKLNVVMVRDVTEKFFVENHVNVITGPIESLETIAKSLQSSETITFIGELLGSTQMSQYELECIVPIFKEPI